ncbi:MAG: 5-methylcytosine-specific restriction endonuclease system specificity protein McrC [Roseburia sp.]|nr:5-methylcytosine-specific restriction endonuclease system specificity protein McrC [Roseburia sp.]
MIKDKTILIKNIYYMLSYAFTPLTQGGYENVEKEEFENIHNLFAAILAKGIGRQLKQGLYREYVGRTESLVTLRGKIDLNGTVKNKLAKQKVISCEVDELSENNLLNQIIKTTVMLLLRQKNVSPDHKSDLKKEMLFFSNVDLIEPTAIHWSSIHFQRNNNTYRMLIGVCQLVLEGMLLTTDKGEYKLAAFIRPELMSRLYEKFILEYYNQEHNELDVSASQIPWGLDDGIDTMLPVMQTDIMLTHGEKTLIIDAKYYSGTLQQHYDRMTIYSNNLYQIFTYVKNKEVEFKDKPHEVSGMLLYAKTDEETCPDNDYKMSGNKIGVHTLDLNVEFLKIREQLDGIAERYFACAEVINCL